MEVFQSLGRAEGRAGRADGIAGGRKLGGLLPGPREGIRSPRVLVEERRVAEVRDALGPIGCLGRFGRPFAEGGEREGRAGELPVAEIVAEIQEVTPHGRLLLENGREVLPDGEVEEAFAALVWRRLARQPCLVVEQHLRRLARPDFRELGIERSILQLDAVEASGAPSVFFIVAPKLFPCTLPLFPCRRRR